MFVIGAMTRGLCLQNMDLVSRRMHTCTGGYGPVLSKTPMKDVCVARLSNSEVNPSALTLSSRLAGRLPCRGITSTRICLVFRSPGDLIRGSYIRQAKR